MAAGRDAASTGDADRWPSLVRRIERGDGSAETELAREFRQRVLTAASVRLNGSDAAEDIAQETLAAVLQALRAGALREPEKLPGFVLGIARNLINNHCRLEARRRGVVADVDELPERAAPADAEGGAAFDEERRALVRQALAHLKPVDRRIVMLTLVEGMSPREIAPVVGLEPDLVRTRKTRAVRAIGRAIEKLTRKGRSDHLQVSGLRR
jgi:RNA polymerase sigma-70 factor (ECF subfamily)